MELVLSIIIIVQTYAGVRFYIKTQKELDNIRADFDNINKQVADIHRHDVEEIYEHVEKEFIELKRDIDHEVKSINNNIEHKKIETENGVREYLNSWRTSSEFKNLLRTIEKQEDKNTSQNVY